MNWGCLSFIILFPVGILIWARGEMRRRAALPPEELKALEAEEDYGDMDPKLECIFCHSKNCVRIQPLTGSLEELAESDISVSFDDWRQDPLVSLMAPKEYIDPISLLKRKVKKAHCMNCGDDWHMFPPEETAVQ